MSLLHTAILEDIPPGSIILYGVLNWGLGHASRSIPVINALKESGHIVHVATDGASLSLMQKELTGVTWHELPEITFLFPGRKIWQNIIALVPAFIKHVMLDCKHVGLLVNSTGANVIVSDNRFVFNHLSVHKNIYITHQCRIYHRFKLVSSLLTTGHLFFIRRFDVCWIPDDPRKKLAGMLSDGIKNSIIRYIGILSRLTLDVNAVKSIDFLFLISGPEPQRTLFEAEIVKIGTDYDLGNVCLIRGSMTKRKPELQKLNWEVFDLANTQIITEKLSTCRFLISRSGYSTLMDMSEIQAKVILVPTPGQTEQEYLAENAKRLFPDVNVVRQSRFKQFFSETFSFKNNNG